MATDATGTPTSLGIPKYNPNVDAPSGLGFNAAMDAIDALIAGRIAKPASPAAKDALVWNGTTWEKSSAANPINETHIDPGTNGQVLVTSAGVAGWGAPGHRGFSAYANAAQALAASSVASKVQYNTEVYDSDGWYDTATYRFTPQLAGKYLVSAMIYGSDATTAGKYYELYVYKNGANFALLDIRGLIPGFSFPGALAGSAIVEANGSTDYFEIFASQSDTLARQIQSGGGTNTFVYNHFQAAFVGA